MTDMAISSLSKRTALMPAWLLFAAALTVSLAWSWYFLPNYADDSFIAFRYAARFIAGQGLTWNDGEYVEGYSDLLWILLLAAGGLLHSDLVLVSWVLGLMANVATLAALAWAFSCSWRDSQWLPTASGLAVLSLSNAFAYWGTAGLETALVVALLAWALAITYRAATAKWSGPAAGLMLGLLAISRPDGILFAAGIAAAVFLRDGARLNALRRASILFGIPLAFVLAQLAFRIAYYGSVVPNTAYAKIAFTLDRVWLGFLYVTHGMLGNAVALLVLVAALLMLIRLRNWRALRDLLVFLIPAALWLAYVNAVGGDFFPFFRHGMPALVCIAFALGGALQALPRLATVRAVSLFAGMVALHLVVQQVTDPWHVPRGRSAADALVQGRIREATPRAVERPLETRRAIMDDCRTIGVFLRDAFAAQRPLLAVTYAGCMPYSSQLPALDTLGLTDAYIARHRPPDMGHGQLGHELGDGAYVLSRKPDLVAFCVPPTGAVQPCLRGEIDMARMPEFQRNYRLVLFRSANVDAKLWTRIEDGRLGIKRTRDKIDIPGFLLATQPGVRAEFGRGGQLVAKLIDGKAAVENIDLPAGTWEVTLDAEPVDQMQLAALPADGTSLQGNVLRIESTGALRSLEVHGGPGEIRAISARRLSGQEWQPIAKR